MINLSRINSDDRGVRIKSTRASQLVAILRKSILSGELKPGAKVSLDQLRAFHHVSLSPLREAISRLVSTGLVEMEDQRGYQVAPVSVENLKEVITLRGILEEQALRESIRMANLDWESAVMGSLHRLTRAISHAAEPTGQAHLIEAQADLHAALIANCRMPMTIDLCRTIFDLYARYEHQFGFGLAPGPVDDDSYTSIVNAAVSRDADAATAMLRSHIKRAGSILAARVEAAKTEISRQKETRHD